MGKCVGGLLRMTQDLLFFVFESNTIYNPVKLNVANTIDLTEKLTPLYYFVVSFLKRFKNEIQHDNIFEHYIAVSSSDDPDGDDDDNRVELFVITFNFDDLTNENETMLQKIKLKIKNIIEDRFYCYAFHNQPNFIRVFFFFFFFFLIVAVLLSDNPT